MIQLTARHSSGADQNVRIDQHPDKCPRCHYHIQPKLLSAVLGNGVTAILQCTRAVCAQVFLAYYQGVGGGIGGEVIYLLRNTAPVTPTPPTVSEEVRAVSPTFVEVYRQALAAESQGLDQLTGIGLRKALEFLVKDFLVAERPNDADKIKSTMLGPCIDTYIDDAKIKASAKRAAWLGNDETHYVRKCEDHDITDLKTLLRLTALWIESVLVTRKYEGDMKG
jgi:hypothetical protein